MFRLSLWYSKRMCFGVKHKVIQTNHVWIRKDEEEVFERFGHPETLSNISVHIYVEKEKKIC